MKKLISSILLLLLVSTQLLDCTKHIESNYGIMKIDNKSTNNQISILYSNDQFGFNFTLPDSWKGYKILCNTWEGLAIDSQSGETVVERGPSISIRHPKWTKEKPRQDIPIMIFTIKQWNALQQGKFHIGAAPIGPSELGRNNKYVFALPARYNYAFPEGFQEVEDILKGNPLKATLIN